MGWRRETVEGEKPLGGSEPGISIASPESLLVSPPLSADPRSSRVSSRSLSSSVLSKPWFPVIILVLLVSRAIRPSFLGRGNVGDVIVAYREGMQQFSNSFYFNLMRGDALCAHGDVQFVSTNYYIIFLL